MDLKMNDTLALRKTCRQRLIAIRKTLDTLGTGHLNDPDLKSAGVQRLSMSLEDKELLPRFFKPYQGEIQPKNPDNDDEDYDIICNFPRFNWESISEQDAVWDNGYGLMFYLRKLFEDGYLPQKSEYPCGARYRDFGDFDFGDLLETHRDPMWQVEAAWDTPCGKRPHIKCMVLTNAIGDERLLRSELITIIDIMKKRLQTGKSMRHHIDAPILLFSFTDVYVRVLEASMRGGKLNVRTTKLYNFKEENTKDLTLSMLFARWWFGHPNNEPTTL